MFSFNNVCYLCLDSINNIQSILLQDEDGIFIKEKMKYILTELLNFKPEMPKYICADCLKCLNSAYKFRQKCIRNLTSLQIYMKDKTTNKHNDFSSEIQETNNTTNTNTTQNLMHQIQTNELNTEVDIKTEQPDIDDDSGHRSSSFNETFIKQEPENDTTANSYVASNFGDKLLEEFEDNKIDIKENPLILEEIQPKVTKKMAHIDDAVSDVIPQSKKTFKCDECQKTYSHYVSLYRHNKRSHNGDKPHKCDICNKTFYRKSILTDHKRTHTGDRPYECDICSKSFFNQLNLIQHKRSHTLEKTNRSTDSETRPYKCNMCGRSFTSSVQLEKHVPVHTRNTSFKCNICDLNFVCKHHLNSHNQTHANERPYKCDVCEVTYKSANGLKEHMIKHPV